MEWSALPFHAVCNSAAMLTSTVPACAVYVYSELAQYNTVLYMYMYMYCTVQRSHVHCASFGFSLPYTRCAKGGRMLPGRLFCPSFNFRVSQNYNIW